MVEGLDPASQEAKRTFRLVPSLWAKILPTESIKARWIFLYLTQCLLGFGFFYLLLNFFFKKYGDKTTAILITANFALLYIGKSFFSDAIWFDAYAYFFIALAIFTTNPLLLEASLFLAFFTDERALFAGGLVFIYHLMFNKDKLKIVLPTIFSAYILYAAVRLVLMKVYNLSIPMGEGAYTGFLQFAIGDVLDMTTRLDRGPIGLYTPFKNLWILFFLLLYILRKEPFQFSLFASIMLVFLIVSFSVADITRTLTYAFPFVLIGFERLKVFVANDKTYKNYLLIAILVNIITPNYFIIYTPHWLRPLFLQILDWIK